MRAWLSSSIAVLRLVACSSELDGDKLEADLLAKTKSQGLDATKLSCPRGVTPKQGKVLVCQIQLDGKKDYGLDVTITKVNDDHTVDFDTRWHDGAAVQVAKIAPALADELTKQLGGPVRLDCGHEPLAFLDGERKLHCDLSAGDPKAEVKSKATIDFDPAFNAAGWHLDPPLLSKAKLEDRLTQAVREKAGPAIQIDCGPATFVPRPADGAVMCDVRDGDKAAKLKVMVNDKLDLKSWEIVK